MRERILSGLAALGLTPPEGAADRLLLYSQRLLEKNQVMNLTAITQPEQVIDYHFLDSAALLQSQDLNNKSVIDVGTGAGFPGLVLKILAPSIRLTLLDSLEKRLNWLEELCRELRLDDVSFVHARAEEASHLEAYRDHFEVAVSRAVAPLPLLCELCLPYVAPGGVFLAMKSVNADAELAQARNAIGILGGTQPAFLDYSVPHTDIIHRMIAISKVKPTPKGYPRRWSKMQKGNI